MVLIRITSVRHQNIFEENIKKNFKLFLTENDVMMMSLGLIDASNPIRFICIKMVY